MVQRKRSSRKDNSKEIFLITFNSDKSLMNTKHHLYNSEDDFEFPKLIPNRASTAPPRPLTEIEEFRRSSDFLLLENTVMMSDHLK
jgi:hypothetical protein